MPVMMLVTMLATDTLAQPPDQPGEGNFFLSQVSVAIDQHTTITARLRHQSRLGEQTLVGSGRYWQLATDGRPLTRWEMQTQVAGKTASFLQVFDKSSHLWTDRRMPSGRQVRRLDSLRLQSQLRLAGWGSSASDRPDQRQLATQGRGGLPQLLSDLIRQFDFDPPRPVQHEGQHVDALIGHWRTNQLQRLWPEGSPYGKKALANWPEQLPHHVLLLIDKNFFPRVVEHRHAGDAYLASIAGGLRPARDPLLRYEIFEVRFAEALDRRLFEFKTESDWKDETSLVLERLTQPKAAKSAATGQNKSGMRNADRGMSRGHQQRPLTPMASIR